MRKIEKTGKRILKIAMSLLLGGVAIFFVSCEKEVLGEAQGHIRVNFTLGDAAYGAEEAVMRGAGRKIVEPETVAVPLEGGMHLYATLAEDEGVPLRASTLAENTRLRIVAFQGTTKITDAEYKVNAVGGIEAVTSTGMTLSSYGTYNFVAYSLNKNTVPAYSAIAVEYSANNTDGDDPLWGETGDVLIDSDDQNLSIPMKYVFPKLTVTVNTTHYQGTPSINAIDVGLQGFKASLKNGVFSKGAADLQPFTFSSFSSETSVTGCERVVYAGDESMTSVKVISITLDGVVWGGPLAQFEMQLERSRSYSLTVKMVGKVVWAGSNVYWKWVDPADPTHADGGYLTFDAPGAALEDQRKMGVFFKWGSLVGISPRGSNHSSYGGPVYIPEFNSPTSKSWSTPASSPGWSSLPYVNDNVTGDRYSTYLNDDARNTANDYANWKAKKGDICRYISENGYGPGGNYRMPTSFEMGSKEGDYVYGDADGWTRETVELWGQGTSVTETDGTKVMSNYISNSNGNVTFPATGYREANGSLVYVNYNVVVQSASAATENTQAYLLCGWNDGHTGSMVNAARAALRTNGIVVRCIKN